jgi:stage V sporulation protein T
MKATGIVRRIDDLGRIVIPKEIRRNMKIREGDPLELYYDKDAIIFKKYCPMNDADWKKAGQLISYILDCDFSIFDNWSCVFQRGTTKFENIHFDSHYLIQEIGLNGELWCYIVTECDEGNEKRKTMAANVLKSFLEEYFG